MPSRRSSSLAAALRIKSVAAGETTPSAGKRLRSTAKPGRDQDASFSENDDEIDDVEDDAPPIQEPKRRKVAKSRSGKNVALHHLLFGPNAQESSLESLALPPSRRHNATYHRPLLLNRQHGREYRAALLSWFDGTSASRAMPWRKPWVDPSVTPNLRKTLEKRAYEVWISEIMLQQTRVAVVIDYWNRWMAKWPTIQDLAAAHPDEVLAAWRGLGYYSRATRIHEAAKLVVGDAQMQGLLPAAVDELEAKVPGVGRYTAGAISAIVFGRAEPMVDGNVLRVLSRQLGIFGSVKTDKAVVDALWAAADALAKAVAGDGEQSMDDAGVAISDRPGRWGQALMELGSTICAPKPNCAACPATASCRVYNEGQAIAAKKKNTTARDMTDVEDMCTLCEPFEEVVEQDDAEAELQEPDEETKIKAKAKPKQLTLASFAFTSNGSKSKAAPPTQAQVTAGTLETIADHARRFPIKVIKKAVRAEETIVCAMLRLRDGHYLLQRRASKGLLAGLWEFPSHTLADGTGATAAQRKRIAKTHADGAVRGAKHVGELGSVPWLFSHLRLTMHVHLFTVEDGGEVEGEEDRPMRWSGAVDDESMGTGMRKCWALVKEAATEF
ncbi:hypothetical protein S40288_01788 [Stachybotrys chartarum IBT 40288]|nr:hypothetical protein S40288_01788 [Stachybotrys chartarum IBT 40288]